MTLAEELRGLELSMLSPAGRFSDSELTRLVSEDFREFGGSGVVYDRASLIAVLIKESRQPFQAIDVSDLAAQELAPGAVLVACCSLRQDEARLRSPVWRQESGAWRRVFRQATPASP